MNKISCEEIKKALWEAGVKPGETVFVHSFLGAFGLLNCTIESIISTFQENLTSSGTLIMPTFNYDFCKSGIYDHFNSPSQVGQLTELFRLSDGVKRSLHPVYSFALWGSKQEPFLKTTSSSGFGSDSFFSKINDSNTLILMMGVDFNTLTFIHYIEEHLKVPYRFLKEFRGTFSLGETSQNYVAQIFSRKLELDLRLNLIPIQKEMIDQGIAKSVQLGRGRLISFRANDFFKFAVNIYQKNPSAFLLESL